MASNTTTSTCTLLDMSADVEAAQEYLFTPTEDLFFVVILPTVLIICLGGNTAFIYTVLYVNSMRTVTNSYLVHVAVADMLFVTISVIIYTSAYFMSPIRNEVQFRSFIGCMLSFHFIIMMYFVSLFLITCVTIERYYAICKPLQHRMIAGVSRTNKLIIASWMVGAFFGACVAPRYSGLKKYCIKWPEIEQFEYLPDTIHYCVEVHPDVYLFSELTLNTPFFLAMFANIFMYSSIIFALSQRSTSGLDDASNIAQQQRNQRVRNQVARLLIINGTLFFLCQTPFRAASIHNMMVHQGLSGLFNASQYGAVLVIGRCLVFINSCVNPFAYVMTSSIYREAFMLAVRCRSKKLKSHITTTNGKTQSLSNMSTIKRQ